MLNTELRVLRLCAPLGYRRMPASEEGGFPFLNSAHAENGDEELACYDPEGVVRFDPLDGPRAFGRLPGALARGASARGAGRWRPDMELDRGVYAFLQDRVSKEEEILLLLESFAREAWWQRLECQGPYFVRRVFEDGNWATQILRRLAVERAQGI